MGAFDGFNFYQQRDKMRRHQEYVPPSEPTFFVSVRWGRAASRHFKRRCNAEKYAAQLEARGIQVSRWYK